MNVKELGVVMQDTTLKQYALDKGYKTSYEKMTQSEKVMLRYKFVMDATKNAHGDFARTQEGSANQMRIFTEGLKEVGAGFGKLLLPVLTPIIAKMNELTKFLGKLTDTQKGWVLGLAGVLAVTPVLLIALGGIATGLGAISTLGAPLVLTIAGITGAIALLGTGFVMAYKNSETFRNIVKASIDGVGKAFNTVKGTIKGVFQLFKGDGTQGVITLSKFLPPNLVQGITKTVDFIKSTLKSMATGVSTAFKQIGGMLSTFWKQNGAMIIQALKNVMLVVRPILTALGFLFKTTFKVAFVVVREIVVGTFKAIVGVIKGAINIITGIIQVFAGLFTGNWRKMFSGIWSITKGLIQVIWNGINLMFFGRIIKGALGFAGTLKSAMSSMWQNIRNTFTRFLTNIWNFLRSTFNRMANFAPKSIAELKDGVLNGLSRLRENMFNMLDRMKDKVANTFTNMVEGAKRLPQKLGDAISNGKDRAVQGVRNLGNSMIDKLGGVVNGTIGGINTVTSKLGIGKKLSEWTPPRFSTGTRNGALAYDSLITVGDKGKGNWKGVRELVQFPNGQMRLFNKETTLHAPKGTKVFYNYETEHMLGTPYKFSTGTGAGGFFGDIGRSIVKGFGDIMEFASNPAQFAEKMIANIVERTGFGNLSDFALDMAKGGFNVIKKGVISFITKAFEQSGGNGVAGILDPNQISYHFGYDPAYFRETGRRFHEGVDFPFVYQPVKTPMSGTLRRMGYMAGGYGNWVKVVSGAVELIFAHLKNYSMSPADGSHVKAGQVVGLTGNTGFSTGAHLHFGYRRNGQDLDPEAWLRGLKKGYKTGGLVFGKQLAWLDEENKGEVVIPLNPARRNDAMKLLAYTYQQIAPESKGGNGYRPNIIPNVNLANNNLSNDKLLELMMTMIQKQDEQIKELKEQTKAIQSDRYTTVEANGRAIAEVTHEHHKAIDKRNQRYKPTLAL